MITQRLEEFNDLGDASEPTQTCAVQCDDAEVQLRIESWLLSLDIPWPGPFGATFGTYGGSCIDVPMPCPV